MNTAPKDGTAILVLMEGSDVPQAVRWTKARAGRGYQVGGWRMTWDDTQLSEADGPRYWMPCPDDPDACDGLKPCPFCGGAAEMHEIHDPDGRYIECVKCRASTNIRFSCMEDARPLLMEQWNRRTA